ncbi:MAG: hypothetical protein ACI9LM_004879 [Alteromonadaceae bacterium]|jgi:hypothetical protein
MQPNKTKVALIIGALLLGASGASYAATESFPIIVSTLSDVEITAEKNLTYGANMFINGGASCIMNAATPADAVGASVNGTVAMQYTATAKVDEANYGDLSGLGCVNGANKGTPGVYKIAGIGGISVNIKISGVSTADFSFNPNSGCIVTYDGTTAGADSCAGFVPNAFAASIPLPATATLDAGAQNGELLFTVGGTITIGATDLTPNTPYTADFPVEVVY